MSNLDKGRKLLALTASPNDNEARNAAMKLAGMLRDGRLTLGAGAEAPKEEGFFAGAKPRPWPPAGSPYATNQAVSDFWNEVFRQDVKTAEQKAYEKGWDATFGHSPRPKPSPTR